MEIDKPHLFIEINNKNFIFFVVQYNQNLDFKILEDIKVRSAGVTKGQITDINMSSQVIKDNLNIIEKKIKYTFKKATIINDEDNFKCIFLWKAYATFSTNNNCYNHKFFIIQVILIVFFEY